MTPEQRHKNMAAIRPFFTAKIGRIYINNDLIGLFLPGGTFNSATGGPFVPVMGGTFNPLSSDW